MHARSRLLRLILALLTFGALVTPAGAATTPCQAEYRAAVTAVRSAHLGRGNEQKLVTKLDNAWRKYASLTKNGPDQAVKDVQNALDLLDSNATKQIPPSAVTPIRAAISSFLACLKSTPAPQSGMLTVRTFMVDPTLGGAGASAGAGVILAVDGGDEVARTGSDGTATFRILAGSSTVLAHRYGSQAGSVTVSIEPGQALTVDVVLSDGKQIGERGDVVVDEVLDDGVLPSNFPTLTLRLSRDGAAIPVRTVASAELSAPGESITASGLFTVGAGGEVRLASVETLRTLLDDRIDPFELKLHLIDATGKSYYETVPFAVGRYSLNGTVTASASSGIGTSGLFILAIHSQSGLAFRTTTDGSGGFAFTNLPEGQYQVSTEAQQGSLVVRADQPVVLVADGTVTLPLRSFSDLLNGATPMSGALGGGANGMGVGAQSVEDDVRGQAPIRPVYNIRSASFELAGAEILPLDHYFGTLPDPLETRTEDQLKTAELRTLLGGSSNHTFVSVTALDAAGNVVHRGVIAVDKWIRGHFAGINGEEEHVRIPGRKSFEVRVPAEAKFVRLRHGDIAAEFDLDTITTIPRLRPFEAAGTLGRNRVKSDAVGSNIPNRVDLVIVGDGYQDRSVFDTHAAALEARLLNTTPYKEYAAFIDIHRAALPPTGGTTVNKPARDPNCTTRGTCCTDPDAPAQRTVGNTFFRATFCSDGATQRLLALPDNDAVRTYLRSLTPQVFFDQIMVIVNDSEYGGSGGGFSVVSANSASPDIAIHEYGHTFTGLADEYQSAFPFGTCSDAPGSQNRCEANVTNILNCTGVKWAPWVNTSQCPTTAPGFIGEYEGARYQDNGMYRPEHNCAMRGSAPFCAICRQAYVHRLYGGGWGGRIATIQPGSRQPATTSVDVQVAIGQTFSVSPTVPAATRAVRWFVNDVQVPGVTSPSYRFVPSAPGTYQLRVVVADETPLVHPQLRTPEMDDAETWTVVATKPAAVEAVAVSVGTNPVRTTQSLIVPPGVTKVRIDYRVSTQETANRCPGCADSWLVTVGLSPNTFYFYRAGSISSGPDVVASSTIDISSSQTGSGVRLELVVEAKNNGDENRPTTVTASIAYEEFDPCRTVPPQSDCVRVIITSIEPTSGFFETQGDSSFYSIPPAGARNVIQRSFLMNLNVIPANAQFRLDVDLMDDDLNPIMPILVDVAQLPPAIVTVGSSHYVRVTFADPAPAAARMAHMTTYRFRVKLNVAGKTDDDVMHVSTLTSTDVPGGTFARRPLHALWKMPAGIPRYNPVSGPRESGGDDWTSAGTHAWLSSHASLVTAIDDISGEHASDLGHPDHQFGSDFDMFYFYRTSTSPTAIDQFTALRAAMELAMQGRTAQPAAFATVVNWVTATRTGLDRLLADAVQQITVGDGNVCSGNLPPGSLPAGWMRELLTIGRVGTLDLEVGQWSNRLNDKMLYDCAANDHIKVKLSRCSFGEGGCGPKRRSVRPASQGPNPGGQSIQLGQSATMTVVAIGGDQPIFYQWYLGASGDPSRPIAGAIQPSLTVTPTQSSSYWASIYNYGGAVSSATATVTVVQPCTAAQITSHSQSKTIVAGQVATLTVNSTGTPFLRHEWYVGETGDTSRPLHTAQGESLHIAPAQTSSFWARVWNACGSASTSTITVTVVPPCAPPAVATQPQPKSIIEGQTATLTVGATGTALQYQWFQSADRNGPFAAIPGATSATVNVAPVVTTYYLVRIAGECGNAESVAVGVTVTPACNPPVLTSQPTSRSITEGESVTLEVTTTGTASTYQWYVGQVNNTSSPVPNGTNASLVVTPLTTTSYWVRATNDCGVANSVAATIVVSPACTAPAITTQPQGGAINPGQSLTLTAAASGSNPSYQWFVGLVEDTSSPVIGATGTTLVVSPDVTTRYWMRALNTCGIANTNSVIVLVTPACVPPVIDIAPQPTSIVEGQVATLTVSASGTSLQYQWFAGAANDTSNPVSGGTSATVSVSPGVSTTYWVRVSNACGTVPSPAVLVTVSQSCTAPAVPQTTRVINSPEAGDSVTFEVVPTGGTSPLQFQWFASSPSGSPFVAVPGATQRIITVSPTATSQYYLRVSNACGTADSGVITVDVPPPTTCTAPEITQHPQSQSVVTGGTAVLTVTATGTQPRSYRWYIGNSGDTSQPIANSDSTTLVVTVNADTRRWVRVTNSCGTDDSNTAILTATTACTSPSIFSQPQAVTIQPGQSATLSVGASGSTPRTYQWFSGNGTPLVGATSSSVTVSPTVTTDYYVVVSNECGTRTSQTARVTVESCLTPQITTQPQNVTVPFRGNVTLSVVATGQAPLSYRWYNGQSGDTSAPLFENGVPATNPSVTFQSSTTTFYWVRITNACGFVNSVAAKVTMLDCVRPVITQQPQPVTITQGQSATLSVGVTNNGPGPLSYQWYAMGLDFPSPINGATSPSVTVSPSATTTYYVHVNNGCGMDSSQSVTVTVALCGLPSINSQPQSVTINEGQNATLSVNASGAGLTYQWYFANGQPVSGATGSSLSVSPSQTTSYYVIVRNSCGSEARSNDATVTVNTCNPPVITSPTTQVNLMVRIGLSKNLAVVASGSGLSYQWFRSEPEGSEFVPIPGATGTSVIVSPEEVSRYYVRVTNACGSVDSPQWRIVTFEGPDPEDPPTLP